MTLALASLINLAFLESTVFVCVFSGFVENSYMAIGHFRILTVGLDRAWNGG